MQRGILGAGDVSPSGRVNLSNATRKRIMFENEDVCYVCIFTLHFHLWKTSVLSYWKQLQSCMFNIKTESIQIFSSRIPVHFHLLADVRLLS